MNKYKKYILISTIGILSFTASFLLVNFLFVPNLISKINQNINDREKQFQVENISVYIDYSGNKDNDMYQNLNLSNYKTTAYHALLNCCEVQVKHFPGGLYVEKINGIGIGWLYWVNDENPPSIPSDFFYLLDNDTVYWKYVGI